MNSIALPSHGRLGHLVEAATALAELSGTKPAPSNKLEAEQGMVVSDEEGQGGLKGKGSPEASRSKRETFPQRLMSMLNDDEQPDVISWLPHGRSFVIVRPDVFIDKVLPKYLPPVDTRGATKYASFTRKLNRWGFRQATRGPDTGAFHHPLFRRDKPDLCLSMVCQRSRERKINLKETNRLPPKKRMPDNFEIVDNSQEHPLCNEQTSEPVVCASPVASVTDDSRSVTSNSNNSESSSNHIDSPKPAKMETISNDKSFVDWVVRQRDQEERMKIARALLYDSYMKALQIDPLSES